MIEYEIETTFSSFLRLANSYSQDHEMQLLLSGDQPESKPSFLCLLPQDTIAISQNDPHPWQSLKEKLTFTSNASLEWVGYLSYELSAFSDSDKKTSNLKGPIPLAHFFKPGVICTYQKGTLNVKVHHNSTTETLKTKIEKQKFSSPKLLKGLLSSLPSISSSSLEYTLHSEGDTQSSYLEKIQNAKEYIAAGDIYQVNLSRSLHLKTSANPFDIFYQLFKINPVPFSAFLNFNDHQIISASPERFLMRSNNLLETRPIKGTIQRGESPHEDILRRRELLESPKEDAELSMICDLMRNDLGKVSVVDSVKCIERKRMLELSNVFHLESTIISKPLNKHSLDILQACFPAGSISGCPKLRALEIILEEEQRPRHIYCGSIGYFLGNGDFDFNVAIRTALLKNDLLEVQLGGAITHDSDSQSEYEETAHKGSPFFKVLKKSTLAETLK